MKAGERKIQFRKCESPLKIILSGLSLNNPGGFLLSHAVARAVPSAPRGLTAVFGMGTGVALSTQPPENFFGSGDSNVIAPTSESKS